MSIKSLIQILILSLITIIIVVVYFKYFETKKNIVEEVNLSNQKNTDQLKELEAKVSELELKNKQLNEKINNNKNKTVEITTKTLKAEKQIVGTKDFNSKEINNGNNKIQTEQ